MARDVCNSRAVVLNPETISTGYGNSNGWVLIHHVISQPLTTDPILEKPGPLSIVNLILLAIWVC